MIMNHVYVSDTNSIIYYFENIFNQPNELSDRALRIIESAIYNHEADIRLSIPSVVFIEIYDKWLANEEFTARFFYEVYTPIIESPNVEIKPVERDVIEILPQIRGNLNSHDIHDKIILSSAIMLECPLITTDTDIIRFVEQTNIIPRIVN